MCVCISVCMYVCVCIGDYDVCMHACMYVHMERDNKGEGVDLR